MNNYVTYNDLRDISNRIVSSGKDVDVLLPLLVITTDLPDCTITASLGDITLTASYGGADYRIELLAYGDWTITCSAEIGGVMRSNSRVINVSVVQIYELHMNPVKVYGYRIKEAESDPYARVEYIEDAVGMIPAKMDFVTDVFDYGDWGDIWFVKENKPCMLKYDGTVDYYLDPDDYTKREDGTDSDVADIDYEGNAMSEMPLVYVNRYEDSGYKYELVSDIQINSDYKAYAHMREDASVANYIYYGIYEGNAYSSKLRSISGRVPSGNLTQLTVNAYAANINSFYTITTYMGHELLRTLITLICKTTDSQTGIGKGLTSSYTSVVGTMNAAGQFYGTNVDGKVKAFHLEDIWGNGWERIVGYRTPSGRIVVAPYNTNRPLSDYIDISSVIAFTGYIKDGTLSEYGFFPRMGGATSTTYFADAAKIISGDGNLIVGYTSNTSEWPQAGVYTHQIQALDTTANSIVARLHCIPPS